MDLLIYVISLSLHQFIHNNHFIFSSFLCSSNYLLSVNDLSLHKDKVWGLILLLVLSFSWFILGRGVGVSWRQVTLYPESDPDLRSCPVPGLSGQISAIRDHSNCQISNQCYYECQAISVVVTCSLGSEREEASVHSESESEGWAEDGSQARVIINYMQW